MSRGLGVLLAVVAAWCAPARAGEVGHAGAGVHFTEIAGQRALSGRLIVRPVSVAQRAAALGDGVAARELDTRARGRIAARVLRHVDATDEYIVLVPAGQTDEQFARSLMATGDYAYAEPDWLLSVARTPNDPLEPAQWEHTRIEAPQAWDVTTGSPSVVCAVCDTGVDTSHPDLAPILVPGGAAVGLGPVVPESEGGSVGDVHGHGTMVAGCLGAAGDNALGVAGVGWDLRIMPVRVSNEADGTAYLSDITKGARWAAEQGAKIINCSYEGVSSDSVQETGAYVRSLGALLFWAAGNFDQYWSTFDHEDVVVVGATTPTDERGAFSAHGPGVDVFAPGVGVWTTERGGSYAEVDGTSFSSAIAAGVAGLVWSRNAALTPDQVEQILFASCDDLGEAGDDEEWGWGRVNARHAVQDADPPEEEPGPFAIVAPADHSTGVPTAAHLEWTISSQAVFYRVRVDDDPGFASPEVDALLLTPSFDVVSGALDYATTYRWTVIAENLAGMQTFMPEVATFTTGPMPAPSAFGVLAPEPGETDVSTGPTLVWEASYPSDSYRVVVSTHEDLSEPIVDVNRSAAQSTLGLAPGALDYSATYYWAVTARNSVGTRSTETASFMTAPVPAPGAFALLAPADGAGGVPLGPTLAWTASANAAEYVVEVDSAGTFAAPEVEVVVAAPEIVAVLGPESLEGQRVYHWRVRARNASGEEIASPSASSFTTVAAPLPACAGDLDASGTTDVFDFVEFAHWFGTASGALRTQGDLNGDGAVDTLDFALFASDFGCAE